MSSINRYRNCLFVLFFLFLLNLSGCATHSVWENRSSNTVNISNETIAEANSIYTNCNENSWSNYQAIIPYKINENIAEFPPFSEGYVAIGSDEKLETIINKEEPIVYIDAELLQIPGSFQSKVYYSGYHFGLNNKYGSVQGYATLNLGPGDKNAKKINLAFIKIDNSNSLDSNCELLNQNPIKITLIFKDGSLKYDPYKYPTALRVVLTPFAVILDAVTSPFQLIAFVTVPLWMPK